MTKLYFDNPKGIVLIDGVRAQNCFALDKSDFCIQYIPFDNEYKPITYAVDKRLISTDEVFIIKHCGCIVLKFCPRKKYLYEDCYFQKTLKIDETIHILSCKAERVHTITLETQNEIFHLPLFAKANNISLKGCKISGGQLILIKANIGKKTYVAVIHYDDDYTLVMSFLCDKTYIDNGKIVAEDFLYDCLQRKCVRVLRFSDNAFIEESRHFEYDCYINYPDELIPYVLLESICAKDEDMIQRYLSATISEDDLKTLLGDFVGICDCIEYRPYRVNLIYADSNGFYTKTFAFEVYGGKVNYVNCV